jgi:anti-sigma regulatory factor (Ser/Thr protein kinase)
MRVAAEGHDGLSIVVAANDLSVVPRIAACIEGFCDAQSIPRRLGRKFSLALDEVVTNIISHGSSGGACREIAIRVAYRNGDLTAVVSDDGKPFNPLLQPPPDIDAAIEDRPIGGLGIHLVRTLMDAVDYRWSEGRNCLAFRLHVDPADPSQPE